MLGVTVNSADSVNQTSPRVFMKIMTSRAAASNAAESLSDTAWVALDYDCRRFLE